MIGDDVQPPRGIEFLEMDIGREELVLQREDAKRRFDGARRAEIVVEEIKVARTSSSVRPLEASLAGSTFDERRSDRASPRP